LSLVDEKEDLVVIGIRSSLLHRFPLKKSLGREHTRLSHVADVAAKRVDRASILDDAAKRADKVIFKDRNAQQSDQSVLAWLAVIVKNLLLM
jgi:hypothetical protein